MRSCRHKSMVVVWAASVVCGWAPSLAAQSGLLTLEEAVRVALAHNRSIEQASLSAGGLDDALAAARTQRLPQFKVGTTTGILLTRPTITFEQGAFGEYPGIGPVPGNTTSIYSARKPTAILSGRGGASPHPADPNRIEYRADRCAPEERAAASPADSPGGGETGAAGVLLDPAGPEFPGSDRAVARATSGTGERNQPLREGRHGPGWRPVERERAAGAGGVRQSIGRRAARDAKGTVESSSRTTDRHRVPRLARSGGKLDPRSHRRQDTGHCLASGDRAGPLEGSGGGPRPPQEEERVHTRCEPQRELLLRAERRRQPAAKCGDCRSANQLGTLRLGTQTPRTGPEGEEHAGSRGGAAGHRGQSTD